MPSLHGLTPDNSARPNTDPNRPILEVNGAPFYTSGDATLVVLLAAAGLSPAGAHGRLSRAAKAGTVRTQRLSPTSKLYHADDVRALAETLRDA